VGTEGRCYFKVQISARLPPCEPEMGPRIRIREEYNPSKTLGVGLSEQKATFEARTDIDTVCSEQIDTG
jgi:hypothetical protein